MEFYVEALIQELAKGASPVPVASLFFGGGTPSLLPLPWLEQIMTTIHQYFVVEHDAEITIEANPDSAEEEKLRGYRSLGINRLSLGVQSFDQECLRTLGRLHTGQEAKEAVKRAQRVGFTNINVDLMMGLPGQTIKGVAHDVRQAVALGVPHISYYSLILEAGTPLAKTYAGMEEDLERQMYHYGRQLLAEAGYHHYEISNWAKPGYSCRHNLRYWQLKDYRGFGVAAHSSVGQERFYHEDDLEAYIAQPEVVMTETISPRERLQERLIMGIRLIDGLDLAPLYGELGEKAQMLKEAVVRLEAQGLVRVNGAWMSLTPKGMDLCNRVELELYEAVAWS